MDITPVVSAEFQLISGYGDGGFTVSGTRHEGSVLILATKTVPWPVASVADITAAHLQAAVDYQPRPGILLIGCGRSMTALPKGLRQELRSHGIVVEPMDTGAACRTYNVLLTEGRDVAAALIAV